MDKIIEGRRYCGELRVEGSLDFGLVTEGLLKGSKAICLFGNLEKDLGSRFRDESNIRTSYVCGFAAKDGELYAITRNSAYKLVGEKVQEVVTGEDLIEMWEELKSRIVSGQHDLMQSAPIDKSAIKYPSTGQFRNVVKNIQNTLTFDGVDENRNVIRKPMPTDAKEVFIGTVKAHGTNGSFVQYADGEIAFQSKERKLLPLVSDNNGFAEFFAKKIVQVEHLFEQAKFIARSKGIPVEYPIVIAGEWMGKGIQKGTAVSELERLFMIFGVAFGRDERGLKWTSNFSMMNLSAPSINIYNTMDFGWFTEIIDFNDPEKSVNKLAEITTQVEDSCPIGKFFGVDGIGEGVVWKPLKKELVRDSGAWFKVKGEKHSSSKVKKLATVDPEKLESVDKFVEYALTRSRLDQAITEVFGEDPIELGPKIGEFLKWINSDIYKEEYDTLETSGLTMKDVGSRISKVAKTYLLSQMK
ncbi:RNA ligase [Salmonella phage SSBI34]|nr:RNA ligase [Salmonella phage SSBI34]